MMGKYEKLKERIKKKLKSKQEDPFFSGKRLEGYEMACANILSIIHELEKGEK